MGVYDIVDGNMGDRNDLDLWWEGGTLVGKTIRAQGNIWSRERSDRRGCGHQFEYHSRSPFRRANLVSGHKLVIRFDLTLAASMSWSNHPNITAIIYAGAPGKQAGPALVGHSLGCSQPERKAAAHYRRCEHCVYYR